MILAEAIAAIAAGQKVHSSNGGVFWLEHDKRPGAHGRAGRLWQVHQACSILV